MQASSKPLFVMLLMSSMYSSSALLVTWCFLSTAASQLWASAGDTSKAMPFSEVHSRIAAALHPFAESTRMIFGMPKWRIHALSTPFMNSVDRSLFNSLNAMNRVASSQIVKTHLLPSATWIQELSTCSRWLKVVDDMPAAGGAWPGFLLW